MGFGGWHGGGYYGCGGWCGFVVVDGFARMWVVVVAVCCCGCLVIILMGFGGGVVMAIVVVMVDVGLWWRY